MNSIRTRTALVVALGVGLSACGGSSSSSSGLSRAQLIAKANAICVTAKKSAGAVAAPSSFQNPTVAAAYFDKIAPITDKETQSLGALQPADSVKTDWTAFVNAQKAADALLQTIKHKADTKDASGFADLQKVAPTSKTFVNAASKLGATGCAS
ncbi:MAG: hypothetical protein M3065_13590 [Actinomycetota bacterium]|nr:hypothetical protein [Actinomycetota bacterium]